MENFRTDEEILNAITESYGDLGTQCSMIVSAFKKGVDWSDNHPRKGLVDINKACEWLKGNLADRIYNRDCYFDTFAELFIEDFRKAMEE